MRNSLQNLNNKYHALKVQNCEISVYIIFKRRRENDLLISYQ